MKSLTVLIALLGVAMAASPVTAPSIQSNNSAEFNRLAAQRKPLGELTTDVDYTVVWTFNCEFESVWCVGVTDVQDSLCWVSDGQATLKIGIFNIADSSHPFISSFPQTGGPSGWGIRDMAYDEATDYVYAGFDGGRYHVYNASTQVPVATYTVSGFSGTVRAMAHSPDEDSLWTGNFASNPMWKFSVTGTNGHQVKPAAQMAACYGLAFDPLQSCFWMTNAGSSGASPMWKIDYPSYVVSDSFNPPGWDLGGGCEIWRDSFLLALEQATPDQIWCIKFNGVTPAEHDVMTVAVTPTMKIAPNRDAEFTMTMRNRGVNTETFDYHYVVFDSTAGDTVYEAEGTITGLAPGGTVFEVMDTLQFPAGKVLKTTAWVYLSGDENPGNDTVRARIEVRLGSSPDGFGYIYESTQEEDTVTFGWIDATGGTQITGWSPSGDDGIVAVTLPFTFRYYDQDITSMNICTNGFIETSALTTYSNTAFPSTVTNHIAPFWDDLDLRTAGAVYQYNDPGNTYTVFSWNGVPRYSASSDLETFQIVLDNQGRIRFNYLTMMGTLNSSTAGIQGMLGGSNWYHQYVYNGEPSHHVAADSVSVLFYYPPYLGVTEAPVSAPARRLEVANPYRLGYLRLPSSLGTGTVKVCDRTGRTVRETQLCGNEQTLSLEGLAEGVYLVRFVGTDKAETQKLVLVR
ncbi:MAG: T9SS type A sorting domain-containing protein [bacterium]